MRKILHFPCVDEWEIRLVCLIHPRCAKPKIFSPKIKSEGLKVRKFSTSLVWMNGNTLTKCPQKFFYPNFFGGHSSSALQTSIYSVDLLVVTFDPEADITVEVLLQAGGVDRAYVVEQACHKAAHTGVVGHFGLQKPTAFAHLP